MLNIAINMDRLIKYIISIEFQIQIHFVTFIRGHSGTPIDPAPVLLSGKPCFTIHSHHHHHQFFISGRAHWLEAAGTASCKSGPPGTKPAGGIDRKASNGLGSTCQQNVMTAQGNLVQRRQCESKGEDS